MARSKSGRTPNGVVELLRLLVVVFFATIGSMIGASFGAGDAVLGPFDATWIGVIIGSGLGYALGGVLGRTTVTAVDRTESSLRSVSAEQIVAGVFGGVLGVLVASVIAWPVFFVMRAALALPLFAFVVVTLSLLGYRAGSVRRDSMLQIFGQQAGLGPQVRATASLPRIIDTSVAIDGRVLDVVRAGFLHGRVLLASPVIGELQGLADAGDDVRRHRGRRGLEVLEALRREPGVVVDVLDEDVPAVHEVDAKLIRLCIDHGAALLTLDTNLAKAAALAGVQVMNMHALALAMRPPVTSGDDVVVLLIKPGKEPGQAVGYLDDGTMVVVERGRDNIGRDVPVRVTSVLTTANGRLVFAKMQRVAPGGGTAPATPAEVEEAQVGGQG